MRLRQPTDFLILEALEETGRNVATNLAVHTEKSRKNINTRLPMLEDYGLVRKIGPADQSGLYEITSRGKAALVNQDLYNDVDDFEAVIEEPSATEVNSQSPQPSFARRSDAESDKD